jgi:ABC-2 type transport system ATP-binding protein
VSNLVISYGPHRVLNGLDLSIAAGEVYALLGGDGAGKSRTRRRARTRPENNVQ